MARIKFRGLEEYELRISRLGKETERIAGESIYEGAGIVANAINANIQALPIVKGYGTATKPLPGGVTATQKAGLIEGFGISTMQNDGGYLNVKLGFDGYNRTRTERYPQGQPNQLVARGVESGTSWKQAHPFVKSAVAKSRKQAEKVMADKLDEEIKKIMD